ncbi:redoxin domain-containing protein [Kribbella sp. CA-294648]|uniref:redoxin domain-containing protein n=1 Tax=Kribbella sp. CA-294648 TaxID=3239948 RepID=UPI003D8D7C4E
MLVRRFAPAALAVALFALSGCGGTDSPPSAGPASDDSVSTPSPSVTPPGSRSTSGSASPSAAVPEALKFTATTLDGKAFDGAALAGKPAVLWFWAPWCPRCRAQAAATGKVAADYQGRVNVVGVAGLDKADAMRGFVTEQKVTGFPHLADETGAVWKRFEVTEQSVYVVLDAKGNKVFTGNLPGGSGLSDKLAELVG